MLRKLSLAAAVAAFSGLAIANASAMPLASAAQGAEQDSEQATAPGVILVAQGCGIGFHRGPWGGCRPNVSPYWPCYWVRTPWGPRRVCH
jgi:hypothetical protein